jgi:penicillin-binding protein 1C
MFLYQNRLIKRLFFLIVLLIIFYKAIPIKNPLFSFDYSHVVVDRNQKHLRVYTNSQDQWIMPPQMQSQIPDRLKTAILTYEDRYFYWHPGFNPVSIWNAYRRNRQEKRIISGASTISMQLVRLSEPKSRTYAHKILELFQAIKLELNYSKEHILNLYISHAPFGGNIQGFYTASILYFDKPPDALTWAQAATLAVLPNSPSLISPFKNPDKLNIKRNILLKKLLDLKKITQSEYNLALVEPIPTQLFPFPLDAAHFSDYIVSKESHQFYHYSTIDRDLQLAIQEIADRKYRELKNLGIQNLSILVADTDTGEILSYIGSQGYFNPDGGQVDGVQAYRSPGSTLKPFLTAMAMDSGIVLPDTVMFDIPTNINGFTPANANEAFYGVVRVKQALVESLNVPAVRLLNQYGVYEFYHFLKQAGISMVYSNPEAYGLSLILGGAEVRLWDLVGLYRMLGRGGQLQPLKFSRSNSQMTSQMPMISKGAAYLTLDILTQLVRPGTDHFWDIYSNQWPIAWKTGTSYGQRDAWAIGVTPQYTIGVWVGNFTGIGNSNLSGVQSAGSLLFDIFNYLPKSQYAKWFLRPQSDLKTVELCSETGLLAGSNCNKTVKRDAPKNRKAMMVCPYHLRLHLNSTGNHQVCSQCWVNGSYQAVNRLVYPPEVRQVLAKNGAILPQVPIHNPAHKGYHIGDVMSWVYPKNNSQIWIPRDKDGEYQKVTCKLAHIDNQIKLFWYLNQQYVGQTQYYHNMPLLFRNGPNELVVIDENGYQIKQTFVAAIKPKER